MKSDELKHHGILGMKWGIRRFQDKNGRLTAEGRRHYDIGTDKEHSKELEKGQKRRLTQQYGVKTDENGDLIIKKGTKFTRFSDTNEAIDSRRKYVSFTDNDIEEYQQAANDGFLWFERNRDKVLKLEYNAKKDLRVASGKTVSDYVLSKYGDMKIKDIKGALPEISKYDRYDTAKAKRDILSIYSDVTFKDLLDGQKIYDRNYYDDRNIKTLSKNAQEWVKDRRQITNSAAFNISKTALKDTETLNYFKDMGYDAIADIEDLGYTDLPLILLNPKDSIVAKKK